MTGTKDRRKLILGGIAAFILFFTALPASAQFEIESEHGTMAFKGRLQVLFVDRSEFDGDDSNEKDRIYIRSARFGIEGDYLHDLTYELEFELRSHIEDGSPLESKNLRIAWEPRRMFKLYAGQFKVPFGRKQLIRRTHLNSVRRPGVAGDFNPGRDIGSMVRVRTFDKRYVFYGGVFTGQGENRDEDDYKGGKLWATRIEAHPFGLVAKKEGDPELSRRPRILVGAGYTSSDDGTLAIDDPEYVRTLDGRKRMWGVDVTLKYRGIFLSYERSEADLEPDGGPAYRAGGYVAQASFFLDRWKLEPRVMYDEFNPSDRTEFDTEKTVTAGLNFMPFGNRFKIMAEYADHHKLRPGDEQGWKEDEFRLMVQLELE